MSVKGFRKGIVAGSWMPRSIRSINCIWSSSVGRRISTRGVRTRRSKSGQYEFPMDEVCRLHGDE